jgi:endonuclease-8
MVRPSMPEGDTLHRVAASLEVLVGDRIEAAAPHPRGAATGVAAAIDGLVLEGVEAVGKNLLLHFEGGVTVRSHLRMSGRWRIEPRGASRSGRPWLVLRGREWEAVQWNGPVLTLGRGHVEALGPDVVAKGADATSLVAAVRGADPRRQIGGVLLDQRVVSGIGTMWLAEMLWHARVSPWARLSEVPDERLRAAFEWVAPMMRAAVAGPRPLRSVYRRAGRPCPRCGSPVEVGRLGDSNRAIAWCPSCQGGETVV